MNIQINKTIDQLTEVNKIIAEVNLLPDNDYDEDYLNDLHLKQTDLLQKLITFSFGDNVKVLK